MPQAVNITRSGDAIAGSDQNTSITPDANTIRKGEQTALRVRDAALRLFARHGYAAVSMRQIANEVGVQPGALYNHFATKQDILKDLMLSHMQGVMRAWQESLNNRNENADMLEHFVRFHIRHHIQCAEAVFISYMELRNLEPGNFAEIEAERQKYEAILTEILRNGQKQSHYRLQEPRVATRAIIAMLTGIPGWFRPDGPLSQSSIEDIYLGMVRGSLHGTSVPNVRENNK